MYNLTCTPKVITSYLLSITGILLTANFFVVHRKLVAPDPVLRGYRAAFYFGAEANFPSFFTALLILAAAAILWKASELSTNTRRESACFKMLSIFVLVLTGEHFFHLHQWLFSLTGEVLPTFFSQYFQLIWYIMISSRPQHLFCTVALSEGKSMFWQKKTLKIFHGCQQVNKCRRSIHGRFVS